MKLSGKVTIVTGASSGMGNAIAREFAKEGATVLAVARRKNRLDELVEQCADYDGKIVAFEADLGIKDNVENMIEIAIKTFGKLDVLVNNAGIMDDMSGIGDTDELMFDKVMNINLKSVFWSMRKAVNYFEEVGGGVIINIASIGGLKGGVAGAAYTASKHAVVGLTKNTAFMYALKNIRCNAICPGGIKTEVGLGEFMQKINIVGAQRTGVGLSLNPRFGEPDEIANVAVFLASDDASFINGQNIVVDGGWTAY